MRIRHAVILCILLLNLSVGLRHASGVEEAGHALALEVVFRTDSDWSLLNFTGLGRVLVGEHEVLAGVEASENYVNFHNGYFTVFTGKEAYDATPVEIRVRLVALDPEDSLPLRVGKGHIGETGVTVMAWAGGGFKEVAAFSHVGVNLRDPVANQRDYRVKAERLSEGRIEVETPALTPGSEKLVLAFHYPWYGARDGPAGGWVHWGEPDGESIPESAHYPILGPYDSLDPGLVEVQIRLAQGAGIDGFISSWWGPGEREDEAFAMLLKKAEELGFCTTIYFESVRTSDRPVLTSLDVARELEYVLDTYGGSEAFLRLWGKPVIFVYNAEAHGRGPGFWAEARSILEKRWGEVFLIGDYRAEGFNGVFDGAHTYIEIDPGEASRAFRRYSDWSIAAPGSDFEGVMEAVRAAGRLVLTRRVSCGTVVPGYDDREVRDPGAMVDRRGGATYGEYWDMAEEASVDWVLVTSWNEWHEGTEIEPSLEHGFEALSQTRVRAAEFKGVDAPGGVSEPALGGTLHVKENPGTYLEVENTGEAPATAVRLKVEAPNIPGGIPWPEEGFSRVIPLVDAGDGFTIILSTQPLVNNSGDLEGFIEYYSLDGTRHELDLSGIPVIIDAGENETDPEAPYVYPPPPGDRGIWMSFRSFEVTLDGWRATVRGEMDILSAPEEMDYASLDVVVDGVVVRGECWSSLPGVSGGNPGVSAPTTVGYEVEMILPEGAGELWLRGYARNSLEDQETIETPRLPLGDHLGGLPGEGLEIEFTRFKARWVGSALLVEAGAKIESYPPEIEYASLDILVDGVFVHGRCWSSLPGLGGVGEGVVAPVEISYTASVPVSPDGVIEVSLRSYARNRLGHQSIVASRPLVIPREGP